MKLSFLDRQDEQRRLERQLRARDSQLSVVYGRRRCGKSTLLQRLCQEGDLYFLADQREARLQLQALATEIGRVLPGFDAAGYPSWDSLLQALEGRGQRINLILDEFPYLVATSPELPGIVQRHLDRPGPKPIHFLLCGSSQHVMQGLVLDRSAPLYGRAEEILKLSPLAPGWIVDALDLQGAAAVEAWSVWGGVPRYWELARRYSNTREAVRDLVLHRHGVLHDEVPGLLLDDLRSPAQASSLLGLVGVGCHRLSEIAARMGKPAGALTRPIHNLIDLGYLEKEHPFGENEQNSKRTLYHIADPFLAFWYRYVLPARTLLQRDLLAPVEATIEQSFPQHVAAAWEQLARASVPWLELGGRRWGPAARWWGTTKDGPREFDVVAESLDGEAVLVGEVKWSTRMEADRWRADLQSRAASAPFLRGRKVVYALWVKGDQDAEDVVGPDRVLELLR